MSLFTGQRLAVLLCCLIGGMGLASAEPSANQTSNPLGESADQSSQPDQGGHVTELALAQRIKLASDIRSAVIQYFAHWQAIPGEDFEADFDRYVHTISQSNGRRAFDKATLALFADLHNGHTGFSDAWLNQHSGHRPGIRVAHRHGQWIVVRSSRPEIAPGQIIQSIDDTPIDAFYDDKKRYIAASNERQRSRQLFARAYLFPRRFTLYFANGDSRSIDRDQAPTSNAESVAAHDPTDWPAGVYYHRIPSFQDPKYEQQALAFIKTHRDANTLILDVRGNGGGMTPNQLIDAVILKPYLGMSEASAMSVGLLAAYGSFANSPLVEGHPQFQALAEAADDYFHRPMMYWPGRLVSPHDPIYRGRLIVLSDIGCASACEDFLMPLKQSHRATIIGDTTYGSTGQPYIKQYDNGMEFRVSAKREFFGDGRPFEGVGIEPDIRIVPSAADLQAGRDPVVAKARALAATPNRDADSASS